MSLIVFEVLVVGRGEFCGNSEVLCLDFGEYGVKDDRWGMVFGFYNCDIKVLDVEVLGICLVIWWLLDWCCCIVRCK